MAKAKAKFDAKQLLLSKGEHIALGVAGLFLAILLVVSVNKWTSAANPEKISKDLKTSAQQVHNKIKSTDLSPEDISKTEPPAWLKPMEFKAVSLKDFPITNPQFDPIAKPDTKKENPTVLDFDPTGYQVDLVKLPFKAFDIIADQDGGNIKIAVIVDKSVGKVDKDELAKLAKNTQKLKEQKRPPANPMPDQGPAPGVGPGGPGGPGPGGPGPGGRPGGGRPGGMGQTFDTNAKRMSIEYIPIEDLDEALKNGKVPAMTVIPLRGALIHMEVPFKKQVEEIKRALRLPTNAEAMLWGPIYDGFEVQRRVLETDGTVVADWADYKFGEKYKELVNSRKVADTFEEGYMSYFIRYDMKLALPLPQLVTELGEYPKIRLPNINNTINKLIQSGIKKVPPSDIAERLRNHTLDDSLYQPVTGADTGASGLFGQNNVGGPGSGKAKNDSSKTQQTGYAAGKMLDANVDNVAPVEIDSLLLRFIDVDIKPGYTYEYRIRVRMLNPNYGHTTEVANPKDAGIDKLYSRWFEINSRMTNITIPPEEYVFATDVGTYRKAIEEAYPGNKERDLRERLQVKDSQAVIEICRWLEDVKLDASKQREPVGAWVVADMPVGRGEFIGRKTYVKLPLWSSEKKSYILREISTTGGKKDTAQSHLPKGWLVNFTTPDILVDFQGGKTQTKTGTKTYTEDTVTELLIVSPDGKLSVKKSREDDVNPMRQQITGVWTKWISEVEKRKDDAKPDEGTFSPKPGMP